MGRSSDNIGAGTLYCETGEGMLGVRPFHGPLVEAASHLKGVAPISYTLPYARALAQAVLRK